MSYSGPIGLVQQDQRSACLINRSHLKALSEAMCKDTTRYNLCGVWVVDIEGEGRHWVATNGHVAFFLKCEKQDTPIVYLKADLVKAKLKFHTKKDEEIDLHESIGSIDGPKGIGDDEDEIYAVDVKSIVTGASVWPSELDSLGVAPSFGLGVLTVVTKTLKALGVGDQGGIEVRPANLYEARRFQVVGADRFFMVMPLTRAKEDCGPYKYKLANDNDND